MVGEDDTFPRPAPYFQKWGILLSVRPLDPTDVILKPATPNPHLL